MSEDIFEVFSEEGDNQEYVMLTGDCKCGAGSGCGGSGGGGRCKCGPGHGCSGGGS